MFLEDPRIPTENNRSKIILRCPVILRHLSFDSSGPAEPRRRCASSLCGDSATGWAEDVSVLGGLA